MKPVKVGQTPELSATRAINIYIYIYYIYTCYIDTYIYVQNNMLWNRLLVRGWHSVFVKLSNHSVRLIPVLLMGNNLAISCPVCCEQWPTTLCCKPVHQFIINEHLIDVPSPCYGVERLFQGPLPLLYSRPFPSPGSEWNTASNSKRSRGTEDTGAGACGDWAVIGERGVC